jgi:hypothetical protein
MVLHGGYGILKKKWLSNCSGRAAALEPGFANLGIPPEILSQIGVC